jgi:serine acetyltransferase
VFLREYIQTIKREDPAAKSSLEILLCYPGLHAVLLHRSEKVHPRDQELRSSGVRVVRSLREVVELTRRA